MSIERAKIGVVPYLNAKPLLVDLKNHVEKLELIYDVPSHLASRLRDKDLDVAIIPILEYFRGPGWNLVPGISISSFGLVRSVKLFSRKFPEDVKRVALDPSSRTSNTLVKIILAEKYNCYPEYIQAPRESSLKNLSGVDAIVKIGDPALRENNPFVWTLDLGLEWTEMTKLPMVYAVWAAYPHFPYRKTILPLLAEAKEKGRENMQVICLKEARRLDLPYSLVTDYLTNNIRFDLGEKELLGMDRFRCYAQSHSLLCEETAPHYGR